MKILLSFLVLLLVATGSFAQTTYIQKKAAARKTNVFSPRTAKSSYNALLKNLEAPDPNGEGYKSFIMRQKITSRRLYPVKKSPTSHKKSSSVPQPIVGKGTGMYSVLFNGTVLQYSGGIPNDNTMAISNDDVLIAGVNNAIWAYDVKDDTTIFSNHLISLQNMANGSLNHNYYDPKIIYDEKADRFILVFLRDNNPFNSQIVVCFSSSNNPSDPWYVYTLPGNPLNNNRWTDYPAISITDEELFITGNLIVPGVSWQVGFDGSIIWQLNKNDGYSNQDSVSSKFYSDIRHNGRLIRNLHTVTGINGTAPRQFLLSNRNFDITNDTIFVLEVNGTLDEPSTELLINVGKTNVPYGVPPNGRQADTDLSDPTKGLQTNDARVLGGITNGDWIQFVSTTVNPATGLAAVYHGHISNPGTVDPEIKGTIIDDDSLDLAYPNLAFTGNDECDSEVIIAFDFTSPNDFPGIGAVYYSNDSSYSELVRIKNGDNYTDRHSDSYERWGDYFGIQRVYDEPGVVWTAGYYGTFNNRNATWINKLTSPDTNRLNIQWDESGEFIYCLGQLKAEASGGIPPYTYIFNGDTVNSGTLIGLCKSDTIDLTVIDKRGCLFQDTIVVKGTDRGSSAGTFPNPFNRYVAFQFTLERNSTVKAYIFDIKGQLVDQIIETNARAGLNELFFDLLPLSQGTYILQVLAGDEVILSEKIIKSGS